MSVRNDIRNRIEAALEKLHARQHGDVRAIILTDEDMESYRQDETKYWRKRLGSTATFHPSTFVSEDGSEYFIRGGKTSMIYSVHGVGVCVPKQLSHRVAA